jgi:hypothetical protein
MQPTPWGINLNVIGGSGIAKSARIRQLSRLMGLPIFPIFVATKAPEHIGGFPVMGPNGFSLECALQQVRSAIDAEKSVLYLDEISSASPATQAALLSFVNERTIGEYVLPPGVRIILAMNPADVAANGRDLETPMANRVCHFDYPPPTLRQWMEYMADLDDPGVPNALDAESIVKDQWRAHYGAVLALTGMFLEAAGGVIIEKDEDGKEQTHSKFFDQPESGDPRASKAWPSPRTWHQAINGVTTARCLGFDQTVQTDVVAGLVGKGIAAEWATFVKKFNLPHPRDVLHATEWPIPKQLDILHVVLPSCATYATQAPEQERLDLAIRCYELLLRVVNVGYADIAMKPLKTLLYAGFNLQHPDSRVEELCMDICAKLNVMKMTRFVA